VLATDFKVLPDRADWADYYKTIAEPRCLNEIQVRPLVLIELARGPHTLITSLALVHSDQAAR
jgi:hypothetical protein